MKKKLLTLIITAFVAFIQMFATDYYISNSGSSTNLGTSSSSPWTLDKLNLEAANLLGGNRVLFNRGETFRGKVKISNQNSSTARFTYGAYGSGAKPILSGAKPITGWVSVNGRYEADASDLITHLFINGKQQTIARYPNTSYATMSSVAQSTITSDALNGYNFTGATCHYRKQNDWIDASKVTSHSGSTINTNYNNINVNNGFFIDDDLEALDVNGEWYQDDVTKKVYLKYGSNPNSLTVEGSVVTAAFDQWASSYITFEDLDIRYYTEKAMKLEIARYVDILGVDFNFCNLNCIRIEGMSNDMGAFVKIDNCGFYDCNNNSVEISLVNNFIFTNNKILRNALVAGYEYPSLPCGTGLNTTSVDNGFFANNIIDEVGYSGMVWSGSNNIFEYNIISHIGRTKNDDGFIQSWGANTKNSIIRYNLCFDGGGNIEGLGPNASIASEGIYFDDFTHDNKIIGNTVWNSKNGIFVQSSQNFEITDNLVYNCTWNQLFLNEKNPNENFPEKGMGWSRILTGVTVKNNVFFANNSTQMAVRTSSDECDTEMDFGTMDNNYVFNPYSSLSFIYSKQPCAGYRTDYPYNLSGWQTKYNQERNSKTNSFIWSESVVQNIGNNLTPNGTFDSNISGYSGYQANFAVSWANNVTGMDGGCIKVTNRETEGDLSSPVFDVVQGKKYVLRFKVKGSASNNIKALMVENNPFNYMSPNVILGYDVNALEHQYIYTATKTVAVKMSLRFAGQDDVWLDNFSVYEAGTITPVNYLEKSKLFYNDTKANKTFDLGGITYKDLDGNNVTGSITLASFKSRILLNGTIPVPPVNIPVTGVSVSPTSTSVGIGQTTTLTASVLPANASNISVTWSSGNTSIATISSNGVVTGVATGTATITVKTNDGNKTATSTITVTAPVVPTGVTVSPTSVNVGAGFTQQLTATVSPANAFNKNVTWSSSNTSVATVSSTGLVSGVAAGSATITVTTVDQGKTATCTVTITGIAPTLTVTARGENGTNEGIAKLVDGNKTTKWLDFSATSWVQFAYSTALTWNKYDITSGNDAPERDPKSWTIQGSNDGTSWTTLDTRTNQTWASRNLTTSYTFTNSTAYKYYKWDITANGSGSIIQSSEFTFANGGGSNVAVTGVTISPTTASVATGATTNLTATVTPSNATNTSVSWSSNNTSIATVNASGVVTGVAAGNATITVTTADGSKTATCAVTITSTNVAVTGVSVSPTTASIAVGATSTLTATVAPSNATNKNVTWSTSASSVATVSSAGVVTGVAAGTATITVTTADGGKTATCAVTVTSAPSITGTVEAEFWTDLSGTAIPAIPTSAPNSTSTLTSVEIPTNAMDNYLVRIRGYIVPSTTGSYTFYIASDDNGQLHLSTNADPANKAQIAYVGNWTNSREWTKETNQKSAVKNLTAGTKYYFEALMKEGGGGDNLAIGWTGPGISAITVIGAANIDKYVASGGGSVAVTGVSVSPTTASIAVGATSTLTASVAPSNATNKNVTWSTNASSVATVSSTGVVTGVAAGSATITVTTADGGKTAACAVTVTTSGGGATTYEAENATKLGGATNASSTSGYTGTGYVQGFNTNYNGVRFSVDVATAKQYNITIRYANGNSLTYQGSIYVNGSRIGNTGFSPISGWAWGTISYNVTLNAGVNTIAIQKDPSDNVGSNGYYIDNISFVTGKSAVEIEVTNSMANNQENGLMIYPNPVSGVLHIANAHLNANITIYSIEGKVITNLKANSENMNIDVANFNKGLYILSMQGVNQNVVTRLVVK